MNGGGMAASGPGRGAAQGHGAGSPGGVGVYETREGIILAGSNSIQVSRSLILSYMALSSLGFSLYQETSMCHFRRILCCTMFLNSETFYLNYFLNRASLVAQLVKNPRSMQETPVPFLG